MRHGEKLDIPDRGNDEEERAGTGRGREGKPFADPEEIEACPVETIIRIWRHDLQGGSAQNSFPAARSNVDKKKEEVYA
jgi:hypothetical protein